VATRGISGLAVVLAAAGGFLVYAGIRNVPILPGLRELASGKVPTPKPVAPTQVEFGIAAGVGTAPVKGPAGGIQGAIDAAYKLGNVRPVTKAAVQEIGPKFGIKTVYGWAPGLYDHPKGLAADFMVNTPGLSKATGDALAAYVIANAARLKVKYVIWYRRSWNPQRGTWVDYHGDSDHTDHVHVSFVE
jgi:hypothetical protein